MDSQPEYLRINVQDGQEMENTENGETRKAKTVIVGSRGRMGKMLLERAKDADMECTGLDQPLERPEIERALADVELVFLCVPAKVIGEVLQKIVPCLPAKTILSDITSVKERPLRQMERAWTGTVVGTHPLFGPKNSPDTDLPVAIVPGAEAGESDIRLVEKFFRQIGCKTFRCDAETHDKAMAKIQNMNFITNLAYFALLAGEKDLLPFITPSFLRRKDAAAKMLNEDAEMFGVLFEANPHSHEVVRQFKKMLNVAAAGDIDLLCKRAQWWWPEDKKA